MGLHGIIWKIFGAASPPETFFRLRILTNPGHSRISVNKTGKTRAERGALYISFDKIDKNQEICQCSSMFSCLSETFDLFTENFPAKGVAKGLYL